MGTAKKTSALPSSLTRPLFGKSGFEAGTRLFLCDYFRLENSGRSLIVGLLIDQFRYIKIQPKITDLSTRLWVITTEFAGFIPQSLELNFNISKNS